jgi:hypothetical protein
MKCSTIRVGSWPYPEIKTRVKRLRGNEYSILLVRGATEGEKMLLNALPVRYCAPTIIFFMNFSTLRVGSWPYPEILD